MSLTNVVEVEVSASDPVKKPRKQSWFNRRRSLFNRRSSRKKRAKQSEFSSLAGDIASSSVKSDELGESSTSVIKGRKNSAISEKPTEEAYFECPLCLSTQPVENCPPLSSCQHRSCLTCLRQYLIVEISESRVNLTCPECQEKLHPSDTRTILENMPHMLVKWEEFTLRRILSTDPDCRWCPAPDCGYAVIAYGCASCPRLVCQRPGCNTEFCYHCRQEWHHNQTCDSAHLQRTKQLRIRSNSGAYGQGSSLQNEIKPCPKCGALIVKLNDGSCNHMTCTVCEVEFCWLCLQEITDFHYLSPSGCTFWGKKPWSRKKKILWQVGLLIGAPLGIGLVATLAIPAIIIGTPVWVARRVMARLQSKDISKHKKNAVVVGATTASALLSPCIAALAVGFGVPVMLFYVYVVVPFSLCRTGSYGVRNQRSRTSVTSVLPSGLRFDLGSNISQTSPSSQDEGVSFHGQPSRHLPTNPSIGEASVGGMTMGSLNTSRGSNLDKIGRSDHDAASTMAMAGTSITGSISGISGSGIHRIEILSKDADQQSTNTQISIGSAPGFTSVQVHTNDNVSENSVSSFPSSSSNPVPLKNTYSVRSNSSKRKTTLMKRSSSARASFSAKPASAVVFNDELASTSGLTKIDAADVKIHNEQNTDIATEIELPTLPSTEEEADTSIQEGDENKKGTDFIARVTLV